MQLGANYLIIVEIMIPRRGVAYFKYISQHMVSSSGLFSAISYLCIIHHINVIVLEKRGHMEQKFKMELLVSF